MRLFLTSLIAATGLAVSHAQTLPAGIDTVPFVCPVRDGPPPQNKAEQLQLETRTRYRAVLPAYFAAVSAEPDPFILMPVEGVGVGRVADTWGALRDGGRDHEGQDIFAPAGTPIYSGTKGYVYRIGESLRGGNTVVVVGGGGRRYYYAHLSAYAETLREGQAVTVDTLLGYVGTTGNAAGTPPHLHLGVYTGEPETCDWDAINPLPLLRDR